MIVAISWLVIYKNFTIMTIRFCNLNFWCRAGLNPEEHARQPVYSQAFYMIDTFLKQSDNSTLQISSVVEAYSLEIRKIILQQWDQNSSQIWLPNLFNLFDFDGSDSNSIQKYWSIFLKLLN